MATDLISMKEVAELLRLDEAAVAQLVQRGELTVVHRGRSRLFDRGAALAWQAAQAKGRGIASLPTVPTGVTVAEAMHPLRVNLNLTAVTRDGVLRELVALVIPPHEKRRATIFFKALKAREELCSTCINEGVAIPHARNAIVGLVDRPLIAYGCHATGVDFGALDKRPVHHFFLLCAPNVREHLQLLARLARLVQRAEFRVQLLTVGSAEELIELVRTVEQGLMTT